MNNKSDNDEHPSSADDFAKHADEPQQGIVSEFWDFLIHNKKWWITPIILVLLVFGILIVLGGTSFAPFIYTIW